MINTEFLKADRRITLRHAIDVLRNGGVVAFPTDTVYGLAALPYTSETIEQLFTVKGRNNSRAIAVLVGDIAHLDRVASNLSSNAKHLIEHFWPGPLTLVVPKHESLPDILSQKKTIGVRMPKHPLALKLLREIGPLAVTSANMSGGQNTTSALEVKAQLNGRIHLIIDGGSSPGGVPSTVVDCTGAELKILRSGPISMEEIKNAII